ncbi:hypothetical protein PBY51_005255 [Eleginops maclovinus]|uniref:Uncharacterized protein n=1 Tax=Eleginops maclovinus TaxID=56733 RepID=A0AAN7X6E8_ELEMC|nr:hypothetical protein PBY51_005255 [Eleginops maclovinus]
MASWTQIHPSVRFIVLSMKGWVESVPDNYLPVVLPVPPALLPKRSLRCQLMRDRQVTGRLHACPQSEAALHRFRRKRVESA